MCLGIPIEKNHQLKLQQNYKQDDNFLPFVKYLSKPKILQFCCHKNIFLLRLKEEHKKITWMSIFTSAFLGLKIIGQP